MAENTALPDRHRHAQELSRANPKELLALWNEWHRSDADLRLAILEAVCRDKPDITRSLARNGLGNSYDTSSLRRLTRQRYRGLRASIVDCRLRGTGEQ
jgi:hypothetical protein